MRREDIEKAAFDCIDAPCVRDCEKCDDKDKDNCTWVYLKDGFIDGANWRINTVWHYDKSSPMLNKPFLFVCHKGAIALQLQNKDDWDLLVKDRIYVKWAYIEDLIPTNE